MSSSDKLPPYRRSSWMILYIANPMFRFFVGKLGLAGSSGIRIIKIKGWKTGKLYSIPIRLLEFNGKRYLVSLQGETFWVKNLRKQKSGELEFGGRTTEFTVSELSDQDKIPILRAYLKRWWSRAKPLTPITSPDAPDEEYIKAAPLHPVFVLN